MIDRLDAQDRIGIYTVKDIWEYFQKNKEPGTKLEGTFIPIGKKGKRLSLEGPDLKPYYPVFTFRLSEGGVFEAEEIEETKDAIPYVNTYFELKELEKKHGGIRFQKIEKGGNATPPVPEVVPNHLPEPAQGTEKDEGLARETRDSMRVYIDQARRYADSLPHGDKRHMIHWWKRFDLSVRVQSLKPGESEKKLVRGFVLHQLRQAATLRPDTSEPIAMLNTFSIQYVPHIRDVLTGDNTVVPLGEDKIKVIATVMHILSNLKLDPEFVSVLREKNIQRISFSVHSWRERAGEKYDIEVPILETTVPPEKE